MMLTKHSGLYGEMIRYMNNLCDNPSKTKSQKFSLTMLLLCISIFLLSGCGINKVIEETQLYEDTKKEGEQIFEHLKNEDIESLSELFCQNKKDESDLNEKWQVFFDEIDGKIISYDKYSCEENMRTFYKGELTYLVLTVKYSNVKTDTGKIYEQLTYTTTAKDSNNSLKEGVSNFILFLGKDDNGYPIAITVD